jgi:transcriptional regulator with XRE-family HTH domain
MDFLKNKRKKKKLTAEKLGEKASIATSSILAIETDKEPIGEDRALRIAEALKIPEDVMTVYRKRLPSYAHKIAKEQPDKLEKVIRKGIKKLEKEEQE